LKSKVDSLSKLVFKANKNPSDRHLKDLVVDKVIVE